MGRCDNRMDLPEPPMGRMMQIAAASTVATDRPHTQRSQTTRREGMGYHLWRKIREDTAYHQWMRTREDMVYHQQMTIREGMAYHRWMTRKEDTGNHQWMKTREDMVYHQWMKVKEDMDYHQQQMSDPLLTATTRMCTGMVQ